MTRVSVSGHIALYPSLCEWTGGLLACAWYEYSSAVEPSPSDIWFSVTRDGRRWSRPVRVTDGISYNNGPSLIQRRSGEFTVGWHSWRPPGREPFVSGGAVANVWIAHSKDGKTWTAPEMPFPTLSGTKYVSLAEDPCGKLWMVFEGKEAGRILISSSEDGRRWSRPTRVRGVEPESGSPDLGISRAGMFHLVYTHGRGPSRRMGYRISLDGTTWKKGARLPSKIGGQSLARPKIGVRADGRAAVASHTESWGRYSYRRQVDLRGGPMRIGIRADGRAGNAFWALNSLEFRRRGKSAVKIFFGPGTGGRRHGEARVTAASPLFGPGRRWGFDKPIRQMIREVGDDETRSLVFCRRPRVFSAVMTPGAYTVTAVFSSWIASVPGVRLEIGGRGVPGAAHGRNDRCCLTEAASGGRAGVTCFPPAMTADHNRPSKPVWTGAGRRPWAAWTSFAGRSVNVVCGKI